MESDKLGYGARRAPRPARTVRQVDKVDERRNQLAESALKTLGELGYAKSSVRDIANNSEFSHGVVPYYFHDKFELIVLLRALRRGPLHAPLRRGRRRRDDDGGAPRRLRRQAPGDLAGGGSDAPRRWYVLRAQSMFEESLRGAVMTIDRTLEAMIWWVVSRYAELSGRESVARPAAAYRMLDGVFQQALLGIRAQHGG